MHACDQLEKEVVDEKERLETAVRTLSVELAARCKNEKEKELWKDKCLRVMGIKERSVLRV